MTKIFQLNIRSTEDLNGGSAEHVENYETDNVEELANILKLSGLTPSVKPDVAQGPTCDYCNCSPCVCDCEVENVEYVPQTGLEAWRETTYETFINTPSTEWPQLISSLTEELIEKGFTKEEAEADILNIMDFGLSENYDFGIEEDKEQEVQIKGNNLDKLDPYGLDQDYSHARYGDNPLSDEDEEENLQEAYVNWVKNYGKD